MKGVRSAKLATMYVGKVVIEQPEDATWSLTSVRCEEWLAEKYLERQFCVNEWNEPEDFASSWLGERAQRNIDWEVRAAAKDTGVHESAFRPCWQKQVKRVVVPVSDPESVGSPREWRLHGTVTTIGQLLIQLGGTGDLLLAC